MNPEVSSITNSALHFKANLFVAAACVPFLNNIDSVQPTIYTLEMKNFGHSDILDQPFANIMHASRISVGNKDRNMSTKSEYLNYISKHIEKTINCPTYLLQN